MDRAQKILEMMVQAINLAASDYEVQIESLPSFVSPPDEVVSTFDEVYILFGEVIQAKLVNQEQINVIEEINEHFEKMQEKTDTDNQWTISAMQKSSDWDALRILAKKALRSLERSQGKPGLNWIVYVPSKKPPID